MKKIILALCLCAVIAASGCGSSADLSSASSAVKSSSSKNVSESSPDTQKAVEAGTEIDDKPSDDKSDSKSDKKEKKNIYHNEAVDAAVKAGKAENMSVDGYYNFYYEGFGKVYSNEELKNCFDRLQKICSEANFNLSFSYENPQSGVIVSYNTYKSYLTCSTIKAPYIKSLLENGVNLDEVIVRNECWSGDGGTVASAAYGTKYTAKQLIEYAVRESDNTAYYLLVKHFGYWNFNNLMYSLGSNYYLGDSWIFTYCTVMDMAKCYKDIYNFAEKCDEGKWLISLMEDTDINTQITAALGDKYDVAHKYGSEFNESNFHDCAVVYSDSPFILCIFTDQQPETEESCKVFRELAKIFDDINSLIAEK